MAISTSYNVTSVQGARENLTDSVKRVAPETTPCFSSLKHGAAPKALLQEWVVDSLGEPNIDNSTVDGADLSFNADFSDNISTRVRTGNRLQDMRRAFAVSRLAEKIDVSGDQNSLYAAAASKALVLLKNDIEGALCSGNIPQTGSSSQGDKLGGLRHWTDPAATNGVWDTAAKRAFRSVTGSRIDTSSTALTEQMLVDALQKIYEAGGKSVGYTLYAGPTTINSISAFSRASQAVTATGASFNVNTPNNVLSLSVTSYHSDWGRLDLVPTLFIGRGAGSAIDNTARKGGLIIPKDDSVTLNTVAGMGIGTVELPDIGGGGRRGFAEWCGTVCVKNARALGSII
ncbi:DUF5309 domain-containing protein [Verrucomicrobia bacterium]|nr:DUF5309 domain-containing protein [Verrucomicrobiota bacterium]